MMFAVWIIAAGVFCTAARFVPSETLGALCGGVAIFCAYVAGQNDAP
jgi:hypothetical protein